MKTCPNCRAIGKLLGKSIWLVRCLTGREFRLNKYKCKECCCKFVNSPRYSVVEVE